MKRRIKMVLWLVCLCFFVTLISTVRPVLAQKAKKEILIGASLPISGPLAMASVEQRWAYEQAVADVNKGGGIFVKEYGKKLPVRLVMVDDEGDPEKAVSAVERLIKHTKVDLLLGGHTAVHDVLPGLITAEKYHKYYHTCFIWIPMFLEHNFKWGTMFFYDPGVDAGAPWRIINSLPEDQRAKKAALLVEDTPDGKILGDIIEASGNKLGYNTVYRASMGLGAKDFSTQVLKCKEAGVDVINVFCDPPEMITLIRQMKQNNYSVKFFFGWKGSWPYEFYKAMGKDAQYIFCDGFWSMDYPFPGCKELGERYYKKYQKYSVSVGMMYALCQVLFQAVEKAGTVDGEKVRQAVLDNEFDTMMGKIRYNDKGIGLFHLAFFQWWNGKQQTVFPFEYTKYKAKIAPPWDKR
jgi:branched-chain amino acid transport system substrate-binding protein